MAPLHYRQLSAPRLNRPILVIGVEGWVDAGLGASNAVASIIEQTIASEIVTFDAEHYLDMRARRPIVHIVDGVNTGLTWPSTQLRAGSDMEGNDVLILSGAEPDFHWGEFTNDLVELAQQFDVRMVVGLGAFPAPTPHTRPVRLTSTAAPDYTHLIEEIGFMPGEIEVPAGVQSALELAFSAAGIPMVSLWARVPHYIASMSFSPASVALLDGLARISNLSLDLSSLRMLAEGTQDQIDELIASNPEHVSMVHRLEEVVDESEGNALGIDELPSGDELAAELERFLRGEGNE